MHSRPVLAHPRAQALLLTSLLLCVSQQPARGLAAPGDARVSTWEAIQSLLIVDFATHDVGNLHTLVTNFGQIGSQPGSPREWAGEPSAEWPAGSGVEYVWVAGPWFGAELNFEPSVTTVAFTLETRPGRREVDRVYVTHEDAAGGARLPSPNADDDADGKLDEDRLNGVDDDGDMLIDEDFAAISDQMFATEYNDTDPAIKLANPDHTPLTLRVESASLAWSDPRIADLIGFDLRVINTGFNPLDNVYFGLFGDFDIGARSADLASEDDRAGFWEGWTQGELGGTTHDVKVSMGYMFDGDGDGGQSNGYVGIVLLGMHIRNVAAPLVANFRMFSGRASFEFGGDPTNDEERYRVLSGTDPLPLPPPDPTSGLRPAQLAPRDDDWRILLSGGKLETFEPGDTMTVQYALVLGPGFDGLLANAARAVVLHANDWRVEGPVAVTIQDFELASTPEGIQLGWRLNAGPHDRLDAVRVQRATVSAGPYSDVATLAPASAMGFLDRSVDLGRTYWYRLVASGAHGDIVLHAGSSVRFDVAAPLRTTLEVSMQRAGGTEIRYGIRTDQRVDLAIYDVRGRCLKNLAGGVAGPGDYVRVWDGREASGSRVARGTYFVRLVADGAVLTRKLLHTVP